MMYNYYSKESRRFVTNGGFHKLKFNMENFAIALVVFVTIVTLFITLMDVWKRKDLSKQTKLNLYFLIFFLPLLGSALYYILFKPKPNETSSRRKSEYS